MHKQDGGRISTTSRIGWARLLGGVAAFVSVWSGAVGGSSAVAPAQPPKNPFLSYDDPQAWTARVQVDVTAYEHSDRTNLEIHSWTFETLAMILPVMRETASAVGEPIGLKNEFRVGDRAYSSAYTVIDGYPGGAAYARWDADELVRVRDISVVLEPSVRCWETTLNEGAASRVGWPEGDWPEAARSTFEPQYGVEYTHQTKASHKVTDAMLARWTEGKDPKSIPPLTLAKYLAGRVLEQVQPTGSGLQRARTSRRTGFEGFAVQGAERTLRSGRGSPFDMAAALAGVYRRAGLPARIVIGLREYDVYDTDDLNESDLSGEGALHAYVEFFLYDEESGDSGWIPVDVVQMRKAGSRAKPLDRDWPFFGTHDELDHFIPLAFHFHPPTTVRAYGSPALWGWFVTPAPPAAAFQQLTFATYNTPVRGGQQPDSGRD